MAPVWDEIFLLTSSAVMTAESMSEPKRENSGSALFADFFTGALSAPDEITLRRSFSVRNSSCSKRAVRSDSVTPFQASASMEKSIGASWMSCVSSRLRFTFSMLARRESPTFPPTFSACARSSTSDPYSTTHLAAVFSPTPGIEGKLSLGSPRSAAKSGYCSGDIPYFS
ncbi:unannotated protein [freshwater metagenome]|uniref:Unannotated protein n=1 Tax=freshwater metagenome TaxID=449393 RepID=A0A6J7TPS1_9ZZZZ